MFVLLFGESVAAEFDTWGSADGNLGRGTVGEESPQLGILLASAKGVGG